MTRIVKIDTEKKRFLGSVRLDECYEGGVETPLSLLKSYLTAREKILDHLCAEHGECVFCFLNMLIIVCMVFFFFAFFFLIMIMLFWSCCNNLIQHLVW